ncbi:unnamed protein product [Ectocarpus sp. 12 AP-2014]
MRKGALHSRLDGTAATPTPSRRFPIGWSAAEEQRQAMVRQGSTAPSPNLATKQLSPPPPHEDTPGRDHRPLSQQELRHQGGAGASPAVPAAVPIAAAAAAAAGNEKNGRWSTRVCNEPGCSTVPSYGAPGTKRKFCKLHAKAGMINVASKKCSHENCGKVATYGVPGGKRERCATHAEEHQVRFFATPTFSTRSVW